MKTLLIPVVLVVAVAALRAQDPPGFQMWKASDLEKRGQEAPINPGTVGLGRWGKHFAALVVRDDKNGPAESHDSGTDLYFIVSGEGTLEVGGEIVEPTLFKAPDGTTMAGEYRGETIKGAVVKRIAAGDVIHIPPKVPHKVIGKADKRLAYVLVKVPD